MHNLLQCQMGLFCTQLTTIYSMYSLRAHRTSSFRNSRNIPKRKKQCRRASSDAAKRSMAGSMTVEAAFAVPLFIFCMINLLYGIQVVETASRVTAALHETGNEICSYGYAIDHSIGEGVPAGLGSMVAAGGSVAGHLGETVSKRGGIKGGISGINYLGSSVMQQGGLVKISVNYRIKYPVNMSIPTVRLGSTYYGHAWVGYDGTLNGNDSVIDDPIVYITPSGTVYHTDLGCSHLNPSTRNISLSQAQNARNSDGSKYYACEICGATAGVGRVYITDYGNRYHGDLYCSGLKRNVKAIHLSEVGGRRACMTCGG